MTTELSNAELDRWAAEVLMGWRACMIGFAYFDPSHPGNLRRTMDWHPSTDITQALGDAGPGTVVGRMAEKGWEFNLDNEAVGFLDDGWCADFMLREESRIIHDVNMNGSTPSIAILRAAHAAYTAYTAIC
jgi:hypothetical protein